MKNLMNLVALSLFLVAGCGGSGSDSSVSSSEGVFKATVTTKQGQKKYELAINCIAFDDENFDNGFMFASDRSGNRDLNNDGIIVRGDRINIGKDKSPIVMDGISLRITDNGIVYESNIGIKATQRKKEIWQKNENGVSGEVDLYLDGNDPFATNLAVYEVICN